MKKSKQIEKTKEKTKKIQSVLRLNLKIQTDYPFLISERMSPILATRSANALCL